MIYTPEMMEIIEDLTTISDMSTDEVKADFEIFSECIDIAKSRLGLSEDEATAFVMGAWLSDTKEIFIKSMLDKADEK